MTFSRHLYIYLSVSGTKLSYNYAFEVHKYPIVSIGETFYSSKSPNAKNKEVIEINNCESCNNELYEGDSYCRECGVELPEPDTFECPECDAEVFEEDSFCFSCGTKFEGLEEEQEEGQEELTPAAPQTAPREPAAQPAAPEVAPAKSEPLQPGAPQPSAPAPIAPQAPPAQPAAPAPPQQPGSGF